MTDDAPLIGMASPDRCPTCGADMAPDQHYCVECGNRRGKPRFSLESRRPVPTPAPVAQKSRFRLTSGATLLLGVAVLMLAILAGEQLGKNNASTSNAASRTPRIVINNTGGGGSGSGSSSASTTATNTTAAKSGSSSKPSSSTKTASLSGKQNSGINIKSLHTKAQKKAATSKALNQKTKLANGKQIGSEKTTLGSKCTSGTVGCTNGKYTGSYFGSGG